LNMLSRLSLQTEGQFGQVTLSLNQIKQCSFYKDEYPAGIIEPGKLRTNINRETFAKKIIMDYEDNFSIDRSFSISPDRIFISPQEYLAAKRYIKSLQTCDIS
jgi:hypothetical protein